MASEAIANLIERVKAFEDNINEYIKESLNSTDVEEEIAFMNYTGQLYIEGINAANVSIWSYQPYAESTIKKKRREGKPYNRVTLRDKGGLEDVFYIVLRDDEFEIRVQWDKMKYLYARYGDNVVGLNEENVQYLSQHFVFPFLRKKLNEVVYC